MRHYHVDENVMHIDDCEKLNVCSCFAVVLNLCIAFSARVFSFCNTNMSSHPLLLSSINSSIKFVCSRMQRSLSSKIYDDDKDEMRMKLIGVALMNDEFRRRVQMRLC